VVVSPTPVAQVTNLQSEFVFQLRSSLGSFVVVVLLHAYVLLQIWNRLVLLVNQLLFKSNLLLHRQVLVQFSFELFIGCNVKYVFAIQIFSVAPNLLGQTFSSGFLQFC
jgi:hypothetical protein